MEMLADFGSGGRYPSNIERDFTTRVEAHLGVSIRPYLFDHIRMTCHIILPHELFGELFWQHPAAAADIMLEGVEVFLSIAEDAQEN